MFNLNSVKSLTLGLLCAVCKSLSWKMKGTDNNIAFKNVNGIYMTLVSLPLSLFPDLALRNLTEAVLDGPRNKTKGERRASLPDAMGGAEK